MYKTCPKCNIHKALENFHKLKKGLYGRHAICKVCRSKQRKASCNNISCTNKLCTLCNNMLNSSEFYKNSSSKDGLQTYCKSCQMSNISKSKSKLNNFAKIILSKYVKKHKTIRVNITYKDVVNKYNEQNGLCSVTKHKMTHNTDIKQRTDNIWNMAILANDNINVINNDNFSLVVHLIYTTKELYNMSIENVKNIYRKLL